MTPSLSRCLPRAAATSPQTPHVALLDAFAGYVSSLLVHDGRRSRQRRLFHTYFVTHLPSSSLHPDSRLPVSGPVSGSVPTVTSPTVKATLTTPAVTRDLTVARIPLRSAKHHFGVASARGQRPYNEDTFQAGTIDIPAFAKRAPISLVRSAVADSRSSGEGLTADSASGDPQIFYFAIFDGHGGQECSDFLRDELPAYIEAAAADFSLTSSLRRDRKGQATRQIAKTAKTDTDTAEPKAIRLQRELLQEYRDTVGGYFRRFRPPSFDESTAPRRASTTSTTTSSPPSIDSVLTYAFLRADLDFVTEQARKPDPDDPRVADFPVNQDEVFGAPHHRVPPSGNGIAGSPLRFKGGSTASVALISTPTAAPFWHPASRAGLLIAHVGDTRVLLCETATGLARPLTRDHHPSSPVEARRLTRFAETLVTDSFGEERISGLANSRAFGDMQSKRIGVSAEPELSPVDIAPAQYAFLVLVSDGVSGTLGDQEIVDLVKDARTPDQAARAVVDFATEVSRDGDNATCLVVRLGGWERRSEGGLGSLGTKEIRDARLAEAQDPRRKRR
ncbi:protein phosphatase [Grosmannia clavigera kw1407]|uniref:Protein phosphatase n=1 Tax=Grosmannia clavigera (strain kw1407 / UAMH 11150) TaxID=655863 RepID=F0XD65_GROCL|nr:protein phosphatase [Grosmannia clavigera kw1407]EFX04355.1 protein phosphatase [Grosmannia clavigera kw1407]